MPISANDANLGFAEFVGKLISEAFEAIADAQLDAVERKLEMANRLRLTPSEYGEAFVESEDVDEAIAAIFAPAKLSGGLVWSAPTIANLHSFVEDESTIAFAVDGAPVSPSLSQLKTVARTAIARTRMLSEVQILNSGSMPNLVVESGEIKAKLTFSVKNLEESGGGASASPGAPSASEAPIGPRPGGLGGIRARLARIGARPAAAPPIGAEKLIVLDRSRPRAASTELGSVRIVANPASSKTTQTSDVMGEVVIRFKSV